MLGERQFINSGVGLADLADWISQLANGRLEQVRLAIEVPHGPVVDALIERDIPVFAINPKQLDRFRDRFTVAGAKDDRRDARVLADSLRTDFRAFRRVDLDAPAIIELREYSRMAEDLNREKNGLTNRLREQLRRFYPQVLPLSSDLAEPWILDLLEAIPTPQSAAKPYRLPVIRRLLKANRIRRVTAEQVLATLREQPLRVAPGTVEAASAHIRLARTRLRLVVEQLRECHRAIDAIFERLAIADEPLGRNASEDGAQAPEDTPGQRGEQCDVAILRSLPGVGRIVLATLLAEASRPLRDQDYHALRALSGVAPVTRRSGKRLVVGMRHACSNRLRNAVYHWARVAAQCDPRWKARYAEFRSRGHTHGRACRAIADRLLHIAIAMLRTRTHYDVTRITQQAPAA